MCRNACQTFRNPWQPQHEGRPRPNASDASSCINAHIHACMHTYIHTCIFVHYVHVCTHKTIVNMCTYVHSHACMNEAKKNHVLSATESQAAALHIPHRTEKAQPHYLKQSLPDPRPRSKPRRRDPKWFMNVSTCDHGSPNVAVRMFHRSICYWGHGHPRIILAA